MDTIKDDERSLDRGYARQTYLKMKSELSDIIAV
jgi:hypothetical protein